MFEVGVFRGAQITDAMLFPALIILSMIVFFNWLFNYFSNKIISSYNRTKKIIDIQDAIIVITDGSRLKECNQAFLNFFGFDSLENFRQEHNCICEKFLEEKGKDYIQAKEGKDISWADRIINNPDKIHKVLLKDRHGQKHIFEVKGKGFHETKTEIEQIFVLNDITLLEYEKDKSAQKEKLLFEQSKMAAMGEMMGNIAHQWRQPLSVISTTATGMRLQNEMQILDDGELQSSCDAINNSAQFLSRTIDDFRNFLKQDKILENYHMIATIEQTLSLVSASIKSHNITLVTDFKEDAELTGYPNELMQALMNVINNAKDALMDKQYDRYLFVESCIRGDDYCIRIKDNGGGIPEAIMSKIFEPYFTTKYQSQGTGIGLYMTYQIIEEHIRGRITVKNVEYEYRGNRYHGAQFTMTLPLEAAAMAT